MGGKRYFLVRQVIYQPKNLTVYPDIRTEDFSFVLMWSQRYCRENFLMSFLMGSARISFFDYENSYVKALKFSVQIKSIHQCSATPRAKLVRTPSTRAARAPAMFLKNAILHANTRDEYYSHCFNC